MCYTACMKLPFCLHCCRFNHFLSPPVTLSLPVPSLSGMLMDVSAPIKNLKVNLSVNPYHWANMSTVKPHKWFYTTWVENHKGISICCLIPNPFFSLLSVQFPIAFHLQLHSHKRSRKRQEVLKASQLVHSHWSLKFATNNNYIFNLEMYLKLLSWVFIQSMAILRICARLKYETRVSVTGSPNILSMLVSSSLWTRLRYCNNYVTDTCLDNASWWSSDFSYSAFWSTF